jgi:hypothetical protein
MRLTEWMSLNEAFEHVLRIVSPNTAAIAEMQVHLGQGSVPACAENEKGEHRELGRDFWADPTTELRNPYGRVLVPASPKLLDGKWVVFLKRSAVMKTWLLEEKVLPEKAAASSAKTKSRFGPQEEFDWEKCAIAVMLKCQQQKGGPPAKVARLMEYAREWFGAHHEPSDSQLRQHMTIIFNCLRTGKPP